MAESNQRYSKWGFVRETRNMASGIDKETGLNRTGLEDYIKVIFKNGPLGALILMTLFTISAMNTNNQMMVFYAQYNLGNIGLQPIVNAIMMGCSIVGVFMIPTLTKHFGQKRTAMWSFVVGAVANIIPKVEATPFPPLKFNHIGKLCPNTPPTPAINPI